MKGTVMFFCPGCGNQVGDETKFCKGCGANLRGVQQAMTSRSTGEKFDWSKTWVAEMFMSEEERERQKGITPEIKRLNEIKAGIITSLVGVGVMIFLGFFMDALANKEPQDAEFLRRLWLVGVVPFLVGVGILFNGLFISKRIVKLQQQQLEPKLPAQDQIQDQIKSRTTDQLSAPASDYSVTENTTANLPEKLYAPPRRETQ
jgi:hypothetical protein